APPRAINSPGLRFPPQRGVSCRRQIELDGWRCVASWRYLPPTCRASPKRLLTIHTALSGDWRMEVAPAFREVNGQNFQVAGKWDRRLRFMLMLTQRVSGPSSDVMRPARYRPQEAVG